MPMAAPGTEILRLRGPLRAPPTSGAPNTWPQRRKTAHARSINQPRRASWQQMMPGLRLPLARGLLSARHRCPT